MAFRVAITNQKGGVGKTTTAVNLSACLAMAGKRTLLIDLDPQANATSGFGFHKDAINKNVYHLLCQDIAVRDVIMKNLYDNLDLIPSKNELTGAEVELIEHENREFVLSNALDEIDSEYDCIVLDCPPALNLLSLNGLVAASHVLMPIQCEYYALEGISQLVNTVEMVNKNLHHNLEIAGILLTMADLRTNLSKQVIDEVRQFFGNRVYNTVIPRNIRLCEAPSFGQPIVHYDPQCTGSKCYLDLTREFIERHFGETIVEKKLYRRLLTWLKRP